MTVGYGEATFPTFVELAAGWLIAAYQVGYGLAAFGGGALQSVVSLASIFRIAAVLAAVMAVLAIPIARRQRVHGRTRGRQPVPRDHVKSTRRREEASCPSTSTSSSSEPEPVGGPWPTP